MNNQYIDENKIYEQESISLKGHFCSKSIFFLNCMAKSSTGIGKIAYWYWPNHIPVLVKSNTSIDEFGNAYI